MLRPEEETALIRSITKPFTDQQARFVISWANDIRRNTILLEQVLEGTVSLTIDTGKGYVFELTPRGKAAKEKQDGRV